MHTKSSNLPPWPARWPMVAAVAGTLALIMVALAVTRPLPPRTVVMATGPEDGNYYAIGLHYRDFFSHHGVTLEVKPSNGSVDNLESLSDAGSGVSVALVANGVTDQSQSPNLSSLGTLFYEPFWLFSRNAPSDIIARLQEDTRVSLGRPGSGTYKIARDLTAALGLDLSRMRARDLGPTEAGEALLRGEVDLVGMLAPFETSIVQRLLRDTTIQVLDWPRADAHIALRPFLSKHVLPRGVADLATDRPPQDVTLVATKTSLIARDDLHPALQYLLLEAASEIHSGPGVFNEAGEFPAAEPIDLPLSEVAREYYRSGRPLLQRYLPFWLAAFASRLLVLLIPLLGVAYPLFRLLPALYGWSMRRRVYRLYGELKFLEAELDAGAHSDTEELFERLDRLEERANHMRFPIAFSGMLYTLKQHIGMVRQRVSDIERTDVEAAR